MGIQCFAGEAPFLFLSGMICPLGNGLIICMCLSFRLVLEEARPCSHYDPHIVGYGN